MATYATYELSEALLTLTPDQRRAIGRIVDHHFVQNKPMGDLFKGDNPICSEDAYYRKGKADPETGKMRRVGWSHQPAFSEALKMAAGLALRTRQVEETSAVQEAVRRARLAAAPLVAGLVRIAANAEADKDKISASKEVLGIALKNTEFGDRPSDGDLADDWWKAAEDE
jgi:hypothetical protein